MSFQETPPFRKPAKAPSAATAADLNEWLELRDAGLARTTAKATVWRNGLAGFVTLLTSVLVLKGSDLTALAQPYRSMTIVGLLGGTALAIIGLWFALAAEAPAEGRASREAVIEKYGSVASYLQWVALASQKKLRLARRYVAAALILLLVGFASWWTGPGESSSTKVRVRWVENSVNRTDCGTLIDSLPREIGLTTSSDVDPLIIPSASIVSIVVVPSC
jgi:hypothetical protein